VDPDQRHLGKLGIALDDLVRDPRQRLRDRLGVENGSGYRGLRGYAVLRAILTFDSFPASRDRLKGVRLGAGLYPALRTDSEKAGPREGGPAFSPLSA
jgi:hypothetical protein